MGETFIYEFNSACAGPNNPGNWSSAACMTWRGGHYNRSMSATYRGSQRSSWASNVLNKIFSTSELAWDTLTLSRDAQLPGIPIKVDMVGRPVNVTSSLEASAQGLLGLSKGSTLLKELKSLGKIASSSFGYAWGRHPESPSGQGSLVLGGYDKARASTQRTTFPLNITEGCPTGLFLPNVTVRIWGVNRNWTIQESCLLPDSELLMATTTDLFTAIMMDRLTHSQNISDRRRGLDPMSKYGTLFPMSLKTMSL